MDYQEVKQIVRESLHQMFEDFRVQKECPKCGIQTTMLKVWVDPLTDASAWPESIPKWRCLNCLGLFTETLKDS